MVAFGGTLKGELPQCRGQAGEAEGWRVRFPPELPNAGLVPARFSQPVTSGWEQAPKQVRKGRPARRVAVATG